MFSSHKYVGCTVIQNCMSQDVVLTTSDAQMSERAYETQQHSLPHNLQLSYK